MVAVRALAHGRRELPFPVFALFTAALLLTAGCGEDTGGRVPVAGTVTLNGSPLDRGSIEFHPVDQGMMTGGTIRDGRFEVPAAQGATPGKYEVRIFAADMEGAPVVNPDEPPGPESERPAQPQLIEPRYNVESELTAEIPEGGATDLSFDLEQ